jgi:DNA-binding MarR family transcriptional regulator/N-acetylglutamate synthase-like GNAT family acetyltransferase
MTSAQLGRRVERVRRFNRFYTRKIGVLAEGLLASPFPLTEARVIWELAQRGRATATEVGGDLGLDAGYMSRIVRRLTARGIVSRVRSETDGRRQDLSLTDAGRAAFARLNAASRSEIETLLGGIAEEDQDRLLSAMATIEGLLEAGPERRVPYILRPHGPGDIGWVIHRHGVLYHREYGWDERFEALVAEVAARFVKDFDAKRERCWIAERDGENVGSVFLVSHPERAGVARLRLLLVEPRARGLGVGRRLVSECTRFARGAGYGVITLWTNSVLHSARRIYEAEGYRLVKSEPHESFGQDLVGETWELEL